MEAGRDFSTLLSWTLFAFRYGMAKVMELKENPQTSKHVKRLYDAGGKDPRGKVDQATVLRRRLSIVLGLQSEQERLLWCDHVLFHSMGPV